MSPRFVSKRIEYAADDHSFMIRRGCLLGLLCFVAIFAIYGVALGRYFEWPENLIAAGFAGIFGAMGLGGMSNILWAWRDVAAFRRGASRTPPSHGALLAAAGPIRPIGAPLTSPIGGRSCVAYEYEVLPRETKTRGRTNAQRRDLVGFAMAASAIDTPQGSIRLLGFPLLDEFYQRHDRGPAEQARIERYVASTPFEQVRGLGALQLLRGMDDAVADADGAVRKDFRLTAEAIPYDARTLRERVVDVGEQVVALGRYDSEKRALVPAGATLNRLWPGTADEVRRRIVSTARSQGILGAVFFVVSHGMLGVAIYQSETRYARDPESYQAAVIRSAVQDGDMAALERAVRQGANPNARDSFGDPVLLDVRDAAMATALIRLGADVNIRHRGDEDTPLIRASRLGLTPLVQVLLAAGANVHATMADGATALSEAERGEHTEIIALLRAAGAGADTPAVERPR
jgi:hypothetical protein